MLRLLCSHGVRSVISVACEGCVDFADAPIGKQGALEGGSSRTRLHGAVFMTVLRWLRVPSRRHTELARRPDFATKSAT